MPFSYATSQDFLSLSNLKIDINFGAYLLYKKMQSESNSVQGTSIKGVTKDELLSRTVLVPTEEEQRQIGTYFRTLDHLITLHQRKRKKPFLSYNNHTYYKSKCYFEHYNDVV